MLHTYKVQPLEKPNQAFTVELTSIHGNEMLAVMHALRMESILCQYDLGTIRHKYEQIALESYMAAEKHLFDATKSTIQYQEVSEAFDRIAEFIKNTMVKINSLWDKFSAWVKKILVSNKSFIAKYEGKELTSCELDTYDYDAAFLQIKEKAETASHLANAFQDITAGKIKYDTDIAGEDSSHVRDALARYYSFEISNTNDFKKKFKEALLPVKYHHTVDGKQLIEKLKEIDVFQEEMKEFTTGIRNVLRKLEAYLSNKEDYMDKYGKLHINPQTVYDIGELASFESREVINAIRLLILQLRMDIPKCAA